MELPYFSLVVVSWHHAESPDQLGINNCARRQSSSEGSRDTFVGVGNEKDRGLLKARDLFRFSDCCALS